MTHPCKRLVEAAHHLENAGMTVPQLSSLHHFSLSGAQVRFSEIYRYFGTNKRLRGNNLAFLERLEFVATKRLQTRLEFQELAEQALSKWPLQAQHSLRQKAVVPSPRLPEAIDRAENFLEGAAESITVNSYERDIAARHKCIQHYGSSCVVCGFNFANVFGPFASGHIHVHHLVPLHAIGKTYVVDPIQDLRPVCPNCHAAIHLGGKTRSIEKMRELLSASASKGRIE